MDVQGALSKLRENLITRGARTISGLSRTFRTLDSFDGNGKIDRNEFEEAMREFAVGLTPTETKMAFDYFDSNKDGVIDIDEFVRGMRGELSEIRKPVVDAAFAKFDNDNTGFIDINDIRGVYDASYHPKVQSGEYTPDQVFEEFLQNFNDADRDGRINKEECTSTMRELVPHWIMMNILSSS